MFCYNLCLIYQHFALCFPFLEKLITLLTLGAYWYCKQYNVLTSDHTRLCKYRLNVTFCHPYSVYIVQCMQIFFSKLWWYRYSDNTVKQKFTWYGYCLTMISRCYDIFGVPPTPIYCAYYICKSACMHIHTCHYNAMTQISAN